MNCNFVLQRADIQIVQKLHIVLLTDPLLTPMEIKIYNFNLNLCFLKL